MSSFVEYLFGAATFVPHGYCLLWRPDLVAMHAIADALTALSYFSIPVAIHVFISRRGDIDYSWLAWLFIGFIGACGLTHIIGLATLWQPAYGLEGMVKLVTAGLSVATATLMWPLLPKVLALPSPSQMQAANASLQAEVLQRQDAETRLSSHAAALERSNTDLEEFAYVASHDLKAPLRVIDNASKWLEEDLEDHLDDDSRENMQLLRGRVQRMEKLLDDLLEYSRIGRKTDQRFAEPIKGDALLDDILSLLSPPEGFRVEVAPSIAEIIVNRMPLQQILLNLISNAIKHHDKAKGHIAVSVDDGGDDYVFSVTDDGPGIPPEFRDQVFKMFQTLKPRDQVEGSGMGLAMVRKQIETFGGALRLEATEGGGSAFRFTWPKNQQMLEQEGKAWTDI